MPYYKGETVSDPFLQGMIEAYRRAYDAVAGAGTAESGDEVIITRLEKANAEQVGAAALGTEDAEDTTEAE